MKIKTDFVTNSSSTCFVLMTKGEFTLGKFLRAAGIDKDSPFQDMFKEMFGMFNENLHTAERFVAHHRWNRGRSFDEFIIEIFSENTLKRIREAEANGMTVYMGDLVSSNDALECFLCTNCFVIDGPELIIDATNDVW